MVLMTQIPITPVLADRIELWPLDRLSIAARHARSHSECQIAQIAASIDEFGFTNPILVNAQGRIIVGYARYLAAQRRKLELVPVIVLEYLSEAQQRAYRIADNQLALNSSWDEEALKQELEALVQEAYSIDLLGFSEEELKRLRACPQLQPGHTDEDAVPQAAAEIVSRVDDLWSMDRHRLLCGDATQTACLEHALGSGTCRHGVYRPAV
jgi:ParB-like chromosome segregation protein Spo0J